MTRGLFRTRSFAFRHGALRRSAVVAATALAVTTVGLVGPAQAGKGPATGTNPWQISVTSSPSPVASGAELTYTIVATNTGGSNVDQSSITDQVNGLTGVDGTNQLVLTSSMGSCTQVSGKVVCSVATVPGFASWTVTIRGKVTQAAGTTLNNTAAVTGTKSATTFTRQATVSTQVTPASSGNLPDLTVSANAPQTIPPDGDYLYVVTVNNTGIAGASDVALTATLPPTTEFKTVVPSSLFACTHDGSPLGGVITCSGGAVNAGANATISIGVNAPLGGSLTFTTAVDPLNTIPEVSELNNAAQALTTVTSALTAGTLAITKVDGPDPIAPYDQLTYTSVVTNTSASRADYLSFVDGTQGLDAASVSVNAVVVGSAVGATCTVTAPTVKCDTTRFQPGAKMTVTVTGVVISAAGTSILNTATVNGNIKNTGVTNNATTITTVRPRVDLTVTQSRTAPVPPAPVRAAALFDYTITVGNSGLKDATGVLVYETLPAGVLYETVSGGDVGSGPVSCTGPRVDGPPGPNAPLQCTVPLVKGAESSGNPQGSTTSFVVTLIAPMAIGPISSTVAVDPNNNIAESDETNNTYLTSVNVLTGIDLTIEKTDSPDPVARNGTLRYTIVVPNLGTQDTSGVVVRDQLPAGAVYRTSQGDHNFTCGIMNGVVTCSGGIIQGTYSGHATQFAGPPYDTATITIDVFAPDTPGSYHNESRVDPANAIPEIDESNNIEFEDTVVENKATKSANGTYQDLWIPQITTQLTEPPTPAHVAQSGMVDYTLTIANQGSADVFNAVVRIELPAGSTYRVADDTASGPGDFTCGHAGGVVTCTGGTVPKYVSPNDGTRKILVSTFAPVAQGSALLKAFADPNNAIGEADESNNQTNKEVVVEAGAQAAYVELHVTDITDNFDPIAPDGTLEYTIPIENTGAADAFGVSFRATLPTGSRFRYADDQGGVGDSFSCTYSGGVVTCTGARINTGTARQVKIGVFAPSAPGLYRLDVVVDPSNAIPEGHEGNNASEEFTTVQLAGGGGYIDLQVAKSVVSPSDDATPGGTVVYHLDVTNAGTDDAFNVLVRDPLPAGTTFVSATAPAATNFTCQNNGGVVDCSGGYVKGSGNGGGISQITLTLKAPLQHDVDIVNQAFVDPLNAIAEASEINNSASVTKHVASKIDLTATNDGSGAGSSGSAGTWKFTIKNAGTADAFNVTVRTDLPIGVIPQNVQVPPGGWNCQITENPISQVTCTVAKLPAGQEAEFDIAEFTTANSGSSMMSTTYADPDNTIVESDETNNQGQSAKTA